jgi:ABC-type uncharacterized transport system involved in gliding motility auxiliary subunit
MAETPKSTGAVDRAAAVAGRVSRRTLAWAGVALAAVILLSVNLIASSALREARLDLTQERLFSISEGTRKVLRAIDEPIDVRVYFSKKLGEVAPNYAKSFERLRTMLEQYRDIARGKLQITYYDPEPFSDAEDRAVAAGLKGVPLNREGEMGYFGIVGSNTVDTETNLPFLSIDRERFFEYDLTKLIVTLGYQRKSTIGLISGISLEGNPGNPMLGRPPTQGPLLLEHIREFFEVRSIAKDVKAIPSDIGVLMVVQPEGLAAETAYAIDQFALSGGKVLAFVDPVAETSRQGNPMFMMMQGPPDLVEFNKLLTAWGVAFNPHKVAADLERAKRVRFGGGPRPKEGSYVLWLGLNRSNLDEKDVLVGDVKELNFATAGVLSKAAEATTQFDPIVRTTSSGMQVAADAVGIVPDVEALLRDYQPGGTPLVIAARASGEAKSAFPGGPPPPPAPEPKAEGADVGKDKNGDKGSEKAGKAPVTKGADNKKGATSTKATEKTGEKKAEVRAPVTTDKKVDAESAKAPPAKPHVAGGRVNIVVVADTDFLQDQFWLEVRELLGQQMAIPTAHNGTFVLAALELLTGSDALMSLRARGIADRPFDRVDDLRRDAEQRFRKSEQVLTARLKEVQTKLAGLRKGEGEELVLSDKDRKEVEKFQGDYLEVRRQLREVKRELRKDIDRLDGVLKFFNIAAMPLLVGLVGVGWAYRRRRITGPQQAAETQQ